MTINEGLAFVRDFHTKAGGLLETVDVVICPPFTALYPLSQLMGESRLQLGAQNMAASTELGRTAQISAALLANAGCRWVMLGHWEVRRHLGDSDALVNHKVHLALEAGLKPILLIGPGQVETGLLEDVIHDQLSSVLAGCEADQVADMAFIYEPETAIGAAMPITPGQVAEGCGLMRDFLRREWGKRVGERVRIIYGGSVSPEHVVDLLSSSEVDGLGASRKGRDAVVFLDIVRQIALFKGR
jgi:triosephosphate isomerase